MPSVHCAERAVSESEFPVRVKEGGQCNRAEDKRDTENLQLPGVAEVRQCGFIAGIELQEAHDAAQVCLQARKRGLLTRPIRNVIVLMPPLCITTDQLTEAVEAIHASIIEVCGPTSAPKNK